MYEAEKAFAATYRTNRPEVNWEEPPREEWVELERALRKEFPKLAGATATRIANNFKIPKAP